MRAPPIDLPPLRVMPKQIPASCFNHARLALIRLGKPLRVVLIRHRGLAIVLDDGAWWCVDGLAGDQPILAWQTFESRGRDNLADPIACELRLYHHCAGLIMGTVLSEMEEAIEGLLARHASARA